ncbi:hint-domain-containing protein [Xylariomycetidae sp. FL2044]|nr:hint-domain-containing protein [Xylariomycetidae sp. FL2044]
MVKEEIQDDWEMLDDKSDVKLESKLSRFQDDLDLSVHALANNEGIVVQVKPPSAPPAGTNIGHIPCDIVLVIDVSGSMNWPALAPANSAAGNTKSENFGLSYLDLTKHAARTILETLDDNDRLGIVTFSHDAWVIQPLLQITKENKEKLTASINEMQPLHMTALWRGIKTGLGLFEGNENSGRVPALMVLTDGLPNYLEPDKGYIPSLRQLGELPATINTFGFGYEIRSGLLKAIAEVSGGNFAFIPDPGMICTVFTHAVAHLQTTYATKCTLEVHTTWDFNFTARPRKTIDQQHEVVGHDMSVVIKLGNLQYGQTRDIYLENVDDNGRMAPWAPFIEGEVEPCLGVKLGYTPIGSKEKKVSKFEGGFFAAEQSRLDDAETAYYLSRAMVCDFLSSFFRTSRVHEYVRSKFDLASSNAALEELLETVPAKYYSDPHNESLMEDLVGEHPAGQIKLAVSDADYFKRWGCHYFLSLWNAHEKQLCNSFRDHGPLMYNQNPFFLQCRDALYDAFNTIPPQRPSLPLPRAPTADPNQNQNTQDLYYQQRWTTAFSGTSHTIGCFAASSRVLLAATDGHQTTATTTPIRDLRRGVAVQTPRGARRVVAVLKTRVERARMCRIGGDLVATPWHPIRMMDDGVGEERWVFPAQVPGARGVRYTGAVYSVLLQPDADVEAHALRIDGVWGVTLGHGLVGGSVDDDVRAHPFWGSYGEIVKEMARLGMREDGVVNGNGGGGFGRATVKGGK